MNSFLGRIFSYERKKIKVPYCAAVVAAAGASERMKIVDKLFIDIGGAPVLAYSLKALQNSSYIKEIVIATREESFEPIAKLCVEHKLDKVTKIILGGETRMESVLIGCGEVSKKAKLIAVHDGARPFVTEKIIADTVKAAAIHNAAAPGICVSDTVKIVKDGFVQETIDRNSVVRIQTPQVFNADILKAALVNARDKELSVTDDCMAVEAIGVRPYVTEGSADNIKLTVPEDVPAAVGIINRRGVHA